MARSGTKRAAVEAPPVSQLPVELLRIRADESEKSQLSIALDSAESQIIITAHPDGSTTVLIENGKTIDSATLFSVKDAKATKSAIARLQVRMGEFFRATLEAFVEARWSRQPPTASGLFPIAARDGSFAGWVEHIPASEQHNLPARWVKYLPSHPTPYRMGRKPEEVHIGWWFTLPIPVPPSAPDWNRKEL